jgi:hypothetical protein
LKGSWWRQLRMTAGKSNNAKLSAYRQLTILRVQCGSGWEDLSNDSWPLEIPETACQPIALAASPSWEGFHGFSNLSVPDGALGW